MDTDMVKLDCWCPEPGRARKLEDGRALAKQKLEEIQISAFMTGWNRRR
jgi:hypothetical protein